MRSSAGNNRVAACVWDDVKRLCAVAVRAVLLLLPLLTVEACAESYDPLAVDPAFQARMVDLSVHDAVALAWLNGPGPRSVMEPADQWQCSPGDGP